MKRNTRYFFFLFVLSLLTVGVLSQRGGSRSRSSSSSSHSSSRYGSHYGANTLQNSNCTTVNGVTTCTYNNSDSSWTPLLIFGGLFSVFCIFAAKKAGKDD